ncbi:MAG: exo-alpha-sialidase [Candidatus Geothermarchaeales archaeon]
MKPSDEGVWVLVGTRKGGFFFHADEKRQTWKAKGPFFKGRRVLHTAFDPGDEATIYSSVHSPHWGGTVRRSTDIGDTWSKEKRPMRFPKGSGLTLEKIWHLEPDPHEPGVLYAGVEPAALFRSEDSGDTWSPVEALNNHDTRNMWEPGGGGLCLHTIIPDRGNPRNMYVGISAAGVFGSTDGGQSWTPLNKGTRADFLPNKYPEVGQCVHKIVQDPGNPKVLYQQNHSGVYRTDNGGEEWVDIGQGLSSDFGFPIAAHPTETGTVYVVPQVSDVFRVTPRGALAVYRSRNGGESWKRLDGGLPQTMAYLGVLREGLATDTLDPAGLYLGTTTGELFHSRDEGESWSLITSWLPRILSVSACYVGS